MRTPPTLLNAVLTRLFPHIIHKAKENRLPTRALHDRLDRQLLLLGTRHRLAVRIARMRPSSLEIIRLESRAHFLQIFELGGDELSGLGRGNAVVEERMDVGGNDVDDAAEGRGVFLQGAHGLGGGDWAGISGGPEGRFGLADEAGKLGHGDVMVEDGLVADDDHFDHGPVAVGPVGDGRDLRLRDRDAGFGDVDAQHEFEVVLLGGVPDVFEPVAVGRVDSDRGEAFAGDKGNVHGDGFGALAFTG